MVDKSNPIGFKCYEQKGHQIYLPNGEPILERDGLQEGMEVLPFINAGTPVKVQKNPHGEFFGVAGHYHFYFEFEAEGLGEAEELRARGWVCAGAANTRGLERLKVFK